MICWVVLLGSCILLPHVAAFEYIGCYKDKYAPNERDLISSVFLQDQMLPAECEQRCGSLQHQYFGLQYGSECWCGDTFGKHGLAEFDSDCDMPCADPQWSCGGQLLNSIYEVTRQFDAPQQEDEQNLLALIMIVKNEAHTLPNTLLSIKPFIDYYYILDTGSSDGTQDAIRRTLGPNGVIFEEPFVDYGTSRNRIIELATQADNAPVFVFMMSADETLYNGAALRQFAEQNRHSVGSTHDAYPLSMNVGWNFDSIRLLRSTGGWRYVGKVHEYLQAPDGKSKPTIRIPDAYIKFKVTDPERRKAREYTIRDILLSELKENPQDSRSSFYLARTYNVLGNHTAALNQFRHRVSLGGWAEEVYEALFAIGWQLSHLNRDWSEIHEAFLAAHRHAPQRAEPLEAIAAHYLDTNQPSIAFAYARRCTELRFPKNAVLWVMKAVYKWKCHLMVGQTALPIGELEIGLKHLVVARRELNNRGDVVILMNQYRKRLGEANYQSIVNGGEALSTLEREQLPRIPEPHPIQFDPRISKSSSSATQPQSSPLPLRPSQTASDFSHGQAAMHSSDQSKLEGPLPPRHRTPNVKEIPPRRPRSVVKPKSRPIENAQEKEMGKNADEQHNDAIPLDPAGYQSTMAILGLFVLVLVIIMVVKFGKQPGKSGVAGLTNEKNV